jgi:tetratricopeptide (TPR) repeat protein
VGANPTESGDNDGRFVLQFPDKQPGETVQIMVGRPGYVVINDVQLRSVLPKDAEAEPLVLLLCKESEREEWARRFYRLKSFGAIRDNYQRKVKELELKHQETVVAMAKLREERDQAKAAADKAADELARLKRGETSELYAEAMSLFLNGKVEEALRVLDEDKLRHSAQVAGQRKAEAEKALAEAIQGYILRARLLTIQFRFDEAQQTYKAALEVAPDSFDTHFAFAYFNHALNRYSEASSAYARSLDLARQSGRREEEALTLNNLGNLLNRQKRMVEARQDYEEALKTYRQLAQQNPEIYLKWVAITLNNLGLSS